MDSGNFIPTSKREPEVIFLRSYPSSFPPTKPICRKDDPMGRIANIRNYTNPWVTGPSDSESEEELEEYSDDNSVFPFEEEYLRLLHGRAIQDL